MTPERWCQLNELLDEAVARDPAQRPAFLDAACGGDVELRREAEEILSFEDQADDFLPQPLIDLERIGSEPAPGELDIGARIGPYRIVELLGHGGMGLVYLAARIDDFEQRVALKLLPRLETRGEALRRFRVERQIQARLEHPHICRLLDGGATEDGCPYFGMEYVDGLPVDVYCDRHELDVCRRLILFGKICDAVHCAHQQLVVHRDLKPSNILVTADGEPKLLDFGIAKLLSPAERFDTLPGSSPMTLRYASPEQVREEPISTASDIYALGVLLHRLLTGRLPCGLDTAGTAEAIRRISEVEPEPPSVVIRRREEVLRSGPVDSNLLTLTPEAVARSRATSLRGLRRALRGDVDAIVLKALRKIPGERYGSTFGLALDLRRHLRGEPVAARHGTFSQFMVKFLRRYRWPVTSAAVALILALVLARRESQRLEAERARAQKVTVFLEELFYSLAPDERQGRTLNAREILAHGSSELETFADEPELYATLAGTLGRIHYRLGHLDEAGSLLAESLAAWRREHPGDSPELARRLSNLGVAHNESGAYRQAEELYREALGVRRRLGQSDVQLVKTMNNLAGVLALRGAYREAEELYRRGLVIRRQVNGPKSKAVATSLRHLGYVFFLRGELDQSAVLLNRALELRIEFYGARSIRVASVLHLLGRVCLAQGELAAAEARLQEALAIRRERLGGDHLAVARSRRQLAAVLMAGGESPAAGVLLARALETFNRQKPAGDWEIADAESLLGAYLAAFGRDDEAEVCLRRGWETLKATRGDEALATVEAQARLEELLAGGGLDG